MSRQKEHELDGSSRRGFLKMVAVAGGAAAAASAVGTAGATEVETPETIEEHVGYRETEHVLDYYAKADL